MFLQFPVELKGLSNGMIVQFQSKQYASVRLTKTFHGNASIYFGVYFLGLVGAWFGKLGGWLNLFRYVIILWSMTTFTMTYFEHHFHPIIATLSEKTSFAKYCLLWVSGYLSLACKLMSFASCLEDRNFRIWQFNLCKATFWLLKLDRLLA